MIRRAIALLALLCFVVAAPPAGAQFADQATNATANGGSANAYTATIPNASQYADLVGVIIKIVPTASNTTASTLNINALGNKNVLKLTTTGLAALSGSELVAAQAALLYYDGTQFELLSFFNGTTLVGSGNFLSSALSFAPPVNLVVSASVSSNQLTVGIGGVGAGPILIPFRNVTIANGSPTIIMLGNSVNLTINSGNTMGCASAQMCRLWLFVINNGGTVGVCAYNANSGNTSIIGLNEAVLQTSASGTSGGSAAQTLYCSISAVTNQAVRYIGYVDIQETTAGTWATGPTYVQLFGPGIKKPGDVVQIVFGTTSSQTACSGANTQTGLQAAIVPTSAANLVEADADWAANSGTTSSVSQFFRLSRGTGPTYFGTEQPLTFTVVGGNTLNVNWGGHLSGIDAPNTTSSTTYSVYCVNGGGANFNGLTQPLSMKVKEIMGALEPANDDLPRARKAA